MSAALAEDACPVSDEMLGQVYRASPEGLAQLTRTIPSTVRAMLAVYCYRRAHMASIAVVIAGTCDEDELQAAGGNAGMALFQQSRANVPTVMPREGKRISLSKGSLRTFSLPVDEMDDEDDAESTMPAAATEAAPMIEEAVAG